MEAIKEVRETGYVVINHNVESSYVTIRGGQRIKTYYDPGLKLVEIVVDLEKACLEALSLTPPISEDEFHRLSSTIYTLRRNLFSMTWI